MTRRTWSTTEVSAYLDGRLARQDQVAFEAQIKQDPALQQRVKEMRNVVAMVRSTPLREPPRNYLLTPSMVADSKPAPRRRGVPLLMMRLATSLVAVAFAVTFGLNLLQRGVTPSMVTKRSDGAQEVATVEREAVPQPQLAPRATETTEEPPMALQAPAPAARSTALPGALPPTPEPEGTQPPPTEGILASAPSQADRDGAREETGNVTVPPGMGGGVGGGVDGIQAQEIPSGTQELLPGTPEPTVESSAVSAAAIEKTKPTSNTAELPEDQGVSVATAPIGATAAPVATPTAAPLPQETAAQGPVPTLPWVTFGLGLATVVLAVVTIWLSRRHIG